MKTVKFMENQMKSFQSYTSEEAHKTTYSITSVKKLGNVFAATSVDNPKSTLTGPSTTFLPEDADEFLTDFVFELMKKQKYNKNYKKPITENFALFLTILERKSITEGDHDTCTYS